VRQHLGHRGHVRAARDPLGQRGRSAHGRHVALVGQHVHVDQRVQVRVAGRQPHRAAAVHAHDRAHQQGQLGHADFHRIERQQLQIVGLRMGGPNARRDRQRARAGGKPAAHAQRDRDGRVVLQTDTDALALHRAAQQDGRRVDGSGADDHGPGLDLAAVGQPHTTGPSAIEHHPVHQRVAAHRQVRPPAGRLQVDVVGARSPAVGGASER